MEPLTLTLQTLHRIHMQLTELQSRFQRGPRQIAAAEQHVKLLEEALQNAKQAVLKNRKAADQRELQLREREARIADLKRKLNACSTNREYQALLEQIAADEQANSVLSDEILEMLDKTTQLQAQAEEAQQSLQQGKADLDRVKTRVYSEKDSLEGDIARVSQDLAAAEQKLPTDFLPDYQRLVKGRGAEALAPLEGECCGACFQTVTLQTHNELMLSKPVFCKSCGCILYLPEKR